MSRIEWTDVTWNPVTGCSKIASGCKHCYAARMANRLKGRYGYPADDPFRVTLHPERLEQPLRWRKPRMVFVCSMGDLFHDDVSDYFIASVFGVMAATPQHTYQVLTKRPERMRKLLSRIDTDDCVTYALGVSELNRFLMPEKMDIDDDGPWDHLIVDPPDWPLSNAWLGTSASTQGEFDDNVVHLLRTPAAVRFVSIEPLLGPIDMRHLDVERHHPDWCFINVLSGRHTDMGRPCHDVPHLDWVIVGGESGPRARPTNPQWVRDIRDQCVEARVPFFFKRWGEYIGQRAIDGREWNEMPK